MLRAAPHDATTRIAKPSYGPLNPILRSGGGDDRAAWGRYDVPGHRTIYTAAPVEGAYAESIAAQRTAQSLSQKTIGEVFSENANDPDARQSILDSIAQEWAERNHMKPRSIARGWREERLEYPVQLPPKGWFVEVEAPESIASVKKALSGLLVERGKEMLTIGDLRGEDRSLTTEIAGWIWSRILDDGSLPLGIAYPSKHGSEWNCWAVWLRATDDGNPGAERTTAMDGSPIAAPAQNSALRRISSLFDVTIH